MSDTQSESRSTTTIIYANQPKSALGAFALTFLFGPLGMLYSTILGGVIMIVIALILVPLTAGLAAFVIWPISMVWGVLAALASKSKAKKLARM